jgi:hypothetical protein
VVVLVLDDNADLLEPLSLAMSALPNVLIGVRGRHQEQPDCVKPVGVFL